MSADRSGQTGRVTYTKLVNTVLGPSLFIILQQNLAAGSQNESGPPRQVEVELFWSGERLTVTRSDRHLRVGSAALWPARVVKGALELFQV